ncbi:response regulator [Clostridium sp. PL3]|uniref:Response regulator n=1 Tax=Clostridium thailandense TaxID=2794346 RepID=A0A949WW81_9CLOT|nr:response regulator [Clostridium thailandense]MBV7274507.1 response regulator [Clostridium thailandense]
MLKAMVIEDEALTNEHTCRLLRNENIEAVGYTNSYEAFDNINIYKPDVLFLDIEMPEMDGLSLAENAYAAGYAGEIVFITAYDQYALDAFRVSALDYLLKPIMLEELNRSIERVKKRRTANLYNKSSNPNKKIRISLFGDILLYIGESNTSIRWMTSKSAEIFAFMLLQKGDTKISKWQLMDEIWSDKDQHKADINLRSTISRLNKTLRENDIDISITCIGNGYKLCINELNVEVDAFKLEDIVFDNTQISDKNFECYDSIISSYTPILEEFNSEWCYEAREIYHRYFINGAKKLLKYYESIAAEPLKMLKIIEIIIKYEPYDEDIRKFALKLHYAIGGKKSVKKYYLEYSDFIKNELQIDPSYSIKKLYNRILNT